MNALKSLENFTFSPKDKFQLAKDKRILSFLKSQDEFQVIRVENTISRKQGLGAAMQYDYQSNSKMINPKTQTPHSSICRGLFFCPITSLQYPY